MSGCVGGVLTPTEVLFVRRLFRVLADSLVVDTPPVSSAAVCAHTTPSSCEPPPHTSYDSSSSPDHHHEIRPSESLTEPIDLQVAEKRLIREAVEDHWLDGAFPPPRDVAAADMTFLTANTVAAIISRASQQRVSVFLGVEPSFLHHAVATQIRRVLRNKRRQRVIRGQRSTQDQSHNTPDAVHSPA